MLLTFSLDPEKTKTGTVATLDELKSQLNIPSEFTDDDQILTDLLAVAVEQVKDDTNSDILDTANVLEHALTINKTAAQVPGTIYINQAPARSLDKIEISNDGTNWTEVDASQYHADLKFSRIEIQFNTIQTAYKIKFTFTTGYEDSKRPKQLKQAAILKAADLFDVERSNFGPTSLADNKTYLRLINKHIRKYW